jgi:UDP-galactopyranose mutase
VIATPDLEIRLSEIRKLWGNEKEETRRFLLNRLRVRKAETDTVNSEQVSIEVVDENTFLELPTSFRRWEIQPNAMCFWHSPAI